MADFTGFLLIVVLTVAVTVTGASADNAERIKRSMRLPTNIDFNQVKEIIPPETQRFYEQLTDEDKNVLQTVLSKSSTYNNISEVLSDLRNGSTTLYDRAVSLVTQMRKTVAALSPSARKFVDESVEQIRTALGETFSIGKVRAEANVIVERYRALEDPVKEELKSAFPTVTSVVYNSMFQTLAAGLLGITTA